MRRIIIMTFILGLAASVVRAQDTTKVTAPCACFLSGGGCGCRVRPVNDYSGLNSLRSRLANPSWDGRLPGIGTGLRLEEGRIRPLSGTTIRTEPDTPDAGLRLLPSGRDFRYRRSAAGGHQCGRGPCRGEEHEGTDHRFRRFGDWLLREERRDRAIEGGACGGTDGEKGSER